MANAHEHKAEKLPDGRIVVRDLPVLAEERATDARFLRERAVRPRLSGKSGVAKPRDVKWLQRCLATLKARVARGFQIPLTFRHSDDNPDLAGEVVPTSIKPVDLNPGEDPRPTIFADHYFDSPETYAEFKRKYRYRSPELSPDYDGEFDAVALLSADAPYNKFATPKVKELFRTSQFYRSKKGLVAGDAWDGRSLMRATPSKQSVAVAGGALGARGLNEKQEVSRMGDLGIAEAPKAEAAGEIDVAPAGGTAEMTLGELAGKLDKLIELHTKGMSEMMACMKSMVEGSKPATMADAGEGTSEAALEAGKPGEGAGGSVETEEDAPGTPSADPAVYRTLKLLRAQVETMRSARADDSKILAETRGEVLGLRKAQAALAAERERTSLVASARNRLAAVGFDLTPDDGAEIEKAAKLGKAHVDSLVAGYVRAAEHAGPSLGSYGHVEAEERLGAADGSSEFPEEIAKLVAMGGETATQAKSLYRSWQGMSPKERAALGGSLEGLLYERDATGRQVPVGRAPKARG